MIISSTSENKDIEKRIAITPEISKKYKSLGLEIYLPKGYGSHLGFNEEDYQKEGVQFLDNDELVISKSNILLQLNILDNEKLNLLKENQTLISVLNPYFNKDKIKN